MTREEPSLETLWLKNIGTMNKVQKIDRRKTAPSSKTFRDESACILDQYFSDAISRNQNIISLALS
jgi:hypothetical protein